VRHPTWNSANSFSDPYETGEVFEQRITVKDPADGRRHRLRRIVLKLDEPTRDGETEIVLVTDLPAKVGGILCCRVYRGRWQIEMSHPDYPSSGSLYPGSRAA
jgi:hypothetical protein